MKYRSRTDIFANMLQAAMEGASKTHLRHSSYASYAQTQEYLPFLQAKGLLMHEEESRRYKLTEKGLRFLRVYEQISEMINVKNS